MKSQNQFCLALLIQVIMTSTLLSQQVATDRVILLEGTTHEGVIIEQKPAEYVKLWRLAEGDTLTMEMDQIDRLVRIVPTDGQQDNFNAVDPPTRRFNTRPFGVMIHAGTGGGDYSFMLLGLSVVYRVNNAFEIGLGGNYHGQTSDNTSPTRMFTSLTADLRYRLAESRTGRFATLISLSSGVAFSFNKNYLDIGRNARMDIRNGLYLYPAIALRSNLFSNMGLMAEIGYQMNTGALVNLETNTKLHTRQYDVFQIKGTLFF